MCSNFSYDGSNIVIEPNPIFKAVIKNSLSNKKLPRLDCLAHSRLTAISHFASWVSPNRKTAPASARSRSNLKQGFRLVFLVQFDKILQILRRWVETHRLNIKKLLEKYGDRTFIKSLHASIIKAPMDFFYKLQGFKIAI